MKADEHAHTEAATIMEAEPNGIAYKQKHSEHGTRSLVQSIGFMYWLVCIPSYFWVSKLMGVILAGLGFHLLFIGMLMPPRFWYSCSQCGNEVVRTSRLCPVCQYELGQPPPTAMVTSLNSHIPLRYVLVAILAVGMLAAGLVMSLGK